MQGAETLPMGFVDEGDKRTALDRCSARLERQGFALSEAEGTEGAVRAPDLIASNGGRTVQVFVLTEDEVDAQETRSAIQVATRRGETRVYAPWPLRWRALSNFDRWDLDGVAVGAW